MASSADGLRFVVPVRPIHSRPNPRYFGQKRGVTYYNLTSDQFTGLGDPLYEAWNARISILARARS